ncbi:hypothetical protein BHM03_00001198 [Ensete ventricosum]|nr:hypothetical protein BHM03_00001198 [Ensete ventricosum]
MPRGDIPYSSLEMVHVEASVPALKLLVCHVDEPELVGTLLLVEGVDELNILPEHIEPLPCLVEVPRHPVVAAPPPLTRVPQALLRCQFLVVKRDGSRRRRSEHRREDALHHVH